MRGGTVNDNSGIKYVYGVSRVNERGLPIEVIGTTPDLEAAMDAAEALGPNYVTGTWAYWN